MARDPETGNDPTARDGEPEGKVEDLESRRRGRSVDNGQDEQDDAGESQGEMFPLGTLSGDPRKTVKNLIRAGAKVTTQVNMSSAAVPNPEGGLFDVEQETQVLVRVLPGEARQTPIHERKADGTWRVKEWKVSQSLAVIHVEHADGMFTRDQVVEMLESVGATGGQIADLLGAPVAQAG